LEVTNFNYLRPLISIAFCSSPILPVLMADISLLFGLNCYSSCFGRFWAGLAPSFHRPPTRKASRFCRLTSEFCRSECQVY